MQAGVGLHMWDVTMAQYNPVVLVATIFRAWAVILSKLSILAFYLRLSPQPWFRTLTFTLMGISTCYVLAYTFLFTFRCKPIPKTGTSQSLQALHQHPCNYQRRKLIMDILTLLLLLLLIPAYSSVRFRSNAVQMLAALQSEGYTWDITEQFYWSYVEVNAGILCVSVPALKPFAKRHLAMVLGSSQRYQGQYQARNGGIGLGLGRRAGSRGRGRSRKLIRSC
ncbi:hypothetical protein BDW68DRAFT_175204 [Aspergillus falconensis]